MTGCCNFAIASRVERGCINPPFRKVRPHREGIVKDSSKNHFVPGYSVELPYDVPDRVSS